MAVHESQCTKGRVTFPLVNRENPYDGWQHASPSARSVHAVWGATVGGLMHLPRLRALAVLPTVLGLPPQIRRSIFGRVRCAHTDPTSIL